MKIYTKIVLDMTTPNLDVIEEESYEYSGEVAKCEGDMNYSPSSGYGIAPGTNGMGVMDMSGLTDMPLEEAIKNRDDVEGKAEAYKAAKEKTLSSLWGIVKSVLQIPISGMSSGLLSGVVSKKSLGETTIATLENFHDQCDAYISLTDSGKLTLKADPTISSEEAANRSSRAIQAATENSDSDKIEIDFGGVANADLSSIMMAVNDKPYTAEDIKTWLNDSPNEKVKQAKLADLGQSVGISRIDTFADPERVIQTAATAQRHDLPSEPMGGTEGAQYVIPGFNVLRNHDYSQANLMPEQIDMQTGNIDTQNGDIGTQSGGSDYTPRYGSLAQKYGGDSYTSALTSSLGGGMGDVSTTSTSTSLWPTAKQQQDALTTWNDFIDSFYGIAPTEGSPGYAGYKDRLTLDIKAIKAADAAYNTKMSGLDTQTKEAYDPYQKQLVDILGQLTNGTGLGKQVSFGFGNKPMASFVPKANRDTANQLLSIGKEGANTGASMLNLDREAAARDLAYSTAHTPNEAANVYQNALEDLMWKLNSGQQTKNETSSANLPEESNYSKILDGITTGATTLDKVLPWLFSKKGTSKVETDPGLIEKAWNALKTGNWFSSSPNYDSSYDLENWE
jgi:hypothetical protein